MHVLYLKENSNHHRGGDCRWNLGMRRVFITGNEVVARAAQAAGAGYLFGYPITPQNEIMHHWRHIASQAGRDFADRG